MACAGSCGITRALTRQQVVHQRQNCALTGTLLLLSCAGRQTLTGYGLHAALSAAATAATAGGGVYKGLSSLSFCDYREPPLCLSQASLAGELELWGRGLYVVYGLVLLLALDTGTNTHDSCRYSISCTAGSG